jgi:acetyl-CoA synthetase
MSYHPPPFINQHQPTKTGVSTRYLFDVRPGDVYWCTADCGWITGHSYLTYGPLLCGATNIVFGSTPAHPDPGRCWAIVEKYRVRQLFTAPTLIRALMQHGDDWGAYARWFWGGGGLCLFWWLSV